MAERTTTVKLSVKDNFSRQLRDFAQAIDDADQKSHRLGNTLGAKLSQRLGKDLVGAAKLGITTLAGLGAQSIRLAMDMEQSKVAFETLTGSAQEANRHLEDLRQFAAKTPFQFTELVDASKRMMAYGFAAQDVLPMLRDIGDATSALGAGSEGINRITRALGQMQARGKVSSQEMLQLTEVGIPAWKFLAEAMGVSTAELQKMVEKGLVPADKGIQAILTGMRQDFGGLMAKQSETAAGQLSNVVDQLEAVGTTIGEIALPAIKDFLSTLSDGLNTLKMLVNWEKDLHTVFQTHQQDMLKLVTATDDSRISVADYNTEIIRSALLTGDAHDVTARYAQQIARQGMEAVAAAHGLRIYNGRLVEVEGSVTLMTEAHRDAFLRAKALGTAHDEAQRALARMGAVAEKTAGAVDTLAISEKEAKAQVERLTSLVDGPVREMNERYSSQLTELTDKEAELTAELDKLSAGHGRAVEARDRDTMSTAELELAQLKLSAAQQKLAETTDPLKQAALNVEIEKLTGKIASATGATTTYVDNSKRMGEVRGELDATREAMELLAAEHDLDTKKFLFNIAAQEVATDRYGQEGVRALAMLGETWGLLDQGTALATDKVLGSLNQLAEDKSITNFTRNMRDAKDAVLSFPDMQRKQIEIITRYLQEGSPSTPEGNIPGSRPTQNQFGGLVMAGRPALIHPPEIFTPQTNGMITSQAETLKMMREAMAGGGGGVSVSIGNISVGPGTTPDMGRQVGREIGRGLAAELRAAKLAGKG